MALAKAAKTPKALWGVSMPLDDKTNAGMLTFMLQHESYHIGQLAILRKAALVSSRREAKQAEWDRRYFSVRMPFVVIGHRLSTRSDEGLAPLRRQALNRRRDCLVAAVADEVAAAAELAMGKKDGIPVVIVRGYEFEKEEGSVKELLRPAAEDLFR